MFVCVYRPLSRSPSLCSSGAAPQEINKLKLLDGLLLQQRVACYKNNKSTQPQEGAAKRGWLEVAVGGGGGQVIVHPPLSQCENVK